MRPFNIRGRPSNNNNWKTATRSSFGLMDALCAMRMAKMRNVISAVYGPIFTTFLGNVQCESKKVAPLKLFAIFSLRLSIFP